LKGKEKARQQK